MDDRAFEALIWQIAEADLTFEDAQRRGTVDPASAKAYTAARAELLEELDRARGTAAVTYPQFVQALEAGASCEVLMELKNRMDPKDPLRDDAIADLRAVGCYSTTSLRRPRDGQR